MIEPNHTCPDIDSVIKELESIQKAVSAVDENTRYIDSTVAALCYDLEKLRNSNVELRTYANYWKDEYEDLKYKYEELEYKYEDLKDERF